MRLLQLQQSRNKKVFRLASHWPIREIDSGTGSLLSVALQWNAELNCPARFHMQRIHRVAAGHIQALIFSAQLRLPKKKRANQIRKIHFLPK